VSKIENLNPAGISKHKRKFVLSINEKEFTLHWTMYEELGSKIFNLHDKWRTFK